MTDAEDIAKARALLEKEATDSVRIAKSYEGTAPFSAAVYANRAAAMRLILAHCERLEKERVPCLWEVRREEEPVMYFTTEPTYFTAPAHVRGLVCVCEWQELPVGTERVEPPA